MRVKFDKIFEVNEDQTVTTIVPISIRSRTAAPKIRMESDFIDGINLYEYKDKDIIGYISNGIFVIKSFINHDAETMKVTAQVVLINPDGLVLGVSRKTDHNDFGLPGGKMEDDDAFPWNAAIRETFEETGLNLTNLQLVFAIHKGGNMGYTYLADYTGEINHNEPHVVKWVPFEVLIAGSFGKYNQLVSESLDSMGIKYTKYKDETVR